MSTLTYLRSMIAVTLGAAAVMQAGAQDVLTGDKRLACEAILCLSTGSRPSECTPSLHRYFSIKRRKWSDTIRDRRDFLDECPAARQTDEMSSLVRAISQGAGRCDAASLNRTLSIWAGGRDATAYISNETPDYCTAYSGRQYTDLSGSLPRYVGTPDRGGYWVEAVNYDEALAQYQARIALEDAERQRSGLEGGL